MPIKYARFAQRFDVDQLRQDVKKLLGSTWISHYQQRDYSGEWDVLALRAIGGDEKNLYSITNDAASVGRSELAYADTPLLGQCPYIASLLDSFECEKTSARLMRLGAHSEIKEHSDTALSIDDGEARLHIPIITSPEIEFYLDQERVQMSAGECWYLDLSLKHRVVNPTDTDRIHLVIDCVTNDWLLAQLHAPGLLSKEYEKLAPRYSIEEARRIASELRKMGTETGNALALDLEREYDIS